MRREHLSYRSFAIVNNDNMKDLAFSAPVKTLAGVPSIAFIFTGQGAQWPAMGAMLLADYQSARRDLQIMEKSLSCLDQELVPGWSLSGMKIHLSLTFTGD
jgi:acyl transferase domain-containing protein